MVIANPGFLLGPGDVHRVSTWPVGAYLAGRLRFTTAGGLSFVDARDVADGLSRSPSEAVQVSARSSRPRDGNLTWDEFFALVGAGLRCPARRMARLPRRLAVAAPPSLPHGRSSPDEVRAAAHWWFCEPAKAERELGFRARPLPETIADTIADHRASRAP